MPLKVAEALDAIVQPRFLQDAGRFGMQRVFRPYGHQWVGSFGPATPEEQRALSSLNSHSYDWTISFLRIPHPRGHYAPVEAHNPFVYRGDTTKIQPDVWHLAVRRDTLPDRKAAGVPPPEHIGRISLSSAEVKLAIAALPKVRAGEKVDIVGETRHVVMRPVRASKEACIGCHKGAKMGDTLGVMVYTVDRMPLAAPKL